MRQDTYDNIYLRNDWSFYKANDELNLNIYISKEDNTNTGSSTSFKNNKIYKKQVFLKYDSNTDSSQIVNEIKEIVRIFLSENTNKNNP